MFIQALESMGKVTDATVAMQQEMFKKWFSLWPGMAAYPPASAEQVERFQKKWAETVSELVRRQREVTETQFKAGMQNIEKAFQVGEAKTPEEFRGRIVELWQKCFDSLHQASEAQVRETKMAVEKWFELMTPPAPSS
jgi:broad specificity phosphatase PhoE